MKFMLTNPEEMAFTSPFTGTKKGYIDRLKIEERSIQKELSKEILKSLKNVDDDGCADLTKLYWKIQSYGIQTFENIFNILTKDDEIILLTFKAIPC